MKTESTISYFKDRYEEENTRFNHIESKCSVILRFLTVIIGVIAAISSTKTAIFSPTSFIEWVVLVLHITGTSFIVLSWGHSLYSLKTANCPVMPKNRDTLNYLVAEDNEKAETHILNCYIDTLEKLGDTISEKAKYFRYSYNELAIGAFLFSIVGAITAILEVTQ
ncbi:MAG: hypothetical protein GY820_25525 [Gammaproteobacteria bacterium]|nr:hypothetical protein [Gammaproteobacteria bacterium]